VKRFWKTAAVIEHDGVFAIELDGRPMRLPGGPSLRLSQRALADAVADEWQAAPDSFSAEDVPLTGLAGTAQARIAPDPGPTADALAAYGATDLLCYRAEAPDALVAREHEAWQPWLDWAAETYGARLRPTHGIMPVTQDPAALAALSAVVHGLGAFTLAGLGILVPAFGSLVLGLAVAAGRLDAAEALGLSILDEMFEEQLWGIDADAQARRAHVARDVGHAARFMALVA
jgi:chaperone required for assembly of F1-ATPase